MPARILRRLAIFWLAACLASVDARADSFAMGADLSLLQDLQDRGVEYKEGGKVKDPLLIFKEHGFNYVRLRLFVAPDGTRGQVNTLAYTLALAKRVRQAGMSFLLDFHYSDGWADPAHQIIPAAWKGQTHAQLVQQIFSYTRDTVDAFHNAGCPPDMVQVGNEITNGMMWPDGGPLKSDAAFDAFADLVKAGIRGVKEADATGAIKIMIHVDSGGSKDVSQWFFDNLRRRGAAFDVIGLSYYPFSQGALAGLETNLAFLSRTYGKDIMVAETGWNAAGAADPKVPFPPTPEGQTAFLQALLRVVTATPGGHGGGIFYWAPEWIEDSRDWENRALFDSAGNMRPAMDAFRSR